MTDWLTFQRVGSRGRLLVLIVDVLRVLHAVFYHPETLTATSSFCRSVCIQRTN